MPNLEYPLAQLAAAVDAVLVGQADKSISGAAPFENAGPDDITYAAQAGLLKTIDRTAAGAILAPKGVTHGDRNILQVDNPHAAFARIMQLFFPRQRLGGGISADARVGRGLTCGPDVAIGAFAVIGNDVVIGRGVDIHPHAVVGDRVVLGDDVTIYPNVTVYAGCRIGDRAIVHAGSVIGADGFGFAPDGDGYRKIPHTGIVRIDADVEIGAGNTIDRATFGKTWIQRGVKTDNLVHIAHNVTIGEHSVIVALAGIAGSVTLGKRSIVAGQAGIAGHLKIGDHVTIGPQAGVAKDIADHTVVSGSPAMAHQGWLRVTRVLPRLPELVKQFKNLEKRLKTFEEKEKRHANTP